MLVEINVVGGILLIVVVCIGIFIVFCILASIVVGDVVKDVEGII